MTAGDLITSDGQIEWRGSLLGGGTAYGWVNLVGWVDLPNFRGDDYDRPSRHGQFPGASLMSSRTITWTFVIATTKTALPVAIDALRTLTAPVENPVEEPLVIRLGGASWRVMARCKRRTVTVDQYSPLGYATGAIQWEATDPKLYSPAEHNPAIGLASPPTTGLAFPLVFPLDFGTGPVGGFLSATNTGSVATWPTFQIDGPVTGPIITNHNTGAQLVFNPTFVVASGQSLLIDTDQRQITLNGVAANQALISRNWFSLLPGVATRIDFGQVGTYSSSALLTCRWRDAAA